MSKMIGSMSKGVGGMSQGRKGLSKRVGGMSKGLGGMSKGFGGKFKEDKYLKGCRGISKGGRRHIQRGRGYVLWCREYVYAGSGQVSKK